MWSSGWCSGDDDPEHKRCVISDAARKRAAKRYTKYGLPRGAAAVKRERESDDLPAVKIEPGEERSRDRGVIGSEDYLVGPDADAFEAALTERTAREQQEEDTRRRRDDELRDLLFEQALAADRELHEKLGAWRREHEEQDKKYIDLVSSDSDE
nr:uncharacterized protein LOC109779802 [Aegilops tauschii subsp. strangulata]